MKTTPNISQGPRMGSDPEWGQTQNGVKSTVDP